MTQRFLKAMLRYPLYPTKTTDYECNVPFSALADPPSATRPPTLRLLSCILHTVHRRVSHPGAHLHMSGGDPLAELRVRLSEATHVLVTAGAGWSADSSLPTYNGSAFYREASAAVSAEGGDGALSYRDVCRPVWGKGSPADREAVFKPFWTQCTQAYLSATPHAGHALLRSLLEEKDYYIYTSNVDGHFLRERFPRTRVAEIHGSVLDWQCCTPEECAGGAGADALFALSAGAVFEDRCPHCGGGARPHVMMFGDDDCIVTPQMGAAYQEWEGRMEASEACRLVVLEFGCGRNVPSVRREGEEVVRDVAELHGADSVRLYRVNASDEDTTPDDDDVAGLVVPIVSTSAALLSSL